MATREPRPSVLVVAHLDPKKRGTLEQQLTFLAAAAAEREIATRMLFAHEPNELVASELAAIGATVGVIDFEKPAIAAARIAEEVLRARPLLCHLHFVRAHSLIARAAAITGARIVATDHLAFTAPSPSAPVTNRLKRVLTSRLTHLLGDCVDRRIAVSAHVAASVTEVERVPWDRIAVIAHGVDLARFAERRPRKAAYAPPRGQAILCVARMAPEKGVDVALRAFAALDRRAALWIVGDGDDRAACERLAGALGISSRVRFLGLRDDVERWLARCDQAWVPSRREAFGLAAAEAMAAARPVVASSVGGLREVVDDGVTGLLVPPDDPAALARAARELIDDRSLSLSMGRAGRQRAERLFGMERFVARTMALYQELVPQFRVAGP